MQYTQETGSNLLLEWYLEKDTKKAIDYDNLICDHFSEYNVIFEINNHKEIVGCKVLSESKVNNDLLTLNRKELISLEPFDFENGINDFYKIVSNNYPDIKDIELSLSLILYFSIENPELFKGIIVSKNSDNITIIGLDKGKLYYYQNISITKLEDLYYLVSAVKLNFFEGEIQLMIESTKNDFETMHNFFSQYFKNVLHLYTPISKVCKGLDSENIVDVNVFALTQYLKLKK